MNWLTKLALWASCGTHRKSLPHPVRLPPLIQTRTAVNLLAAVLRIESPALIAPTRAQTRHPLNPQQPSAPFKLHRCPTGAASFKSLYLNAHFAAAALTSLLWALQIQPKDFGPGIISELAITQCTIRQVIELTTSPVSQPYNWGERVPGSAP